jgi:hypothetical protein
MADRRFSAACFTLCWNLVWPLCLAGSGDCRQAHPADHIDDRTSGEIVPSGNAFEIGCYQRPWREALAPEPQVFFCSWRREVHHRLETAQECLIEVAVQVEVRIVTLLKLSIHCSR